MSAAATEIAAKEKFTANNVESGPAKTDNIQLSEKGKSDVIVKVKNDGKKKVVKLN